MNAKLDYPETVIDKILQLTLRSNSFAWLAIDEDGRLKSQGGECAVFGLPAWQINQSILDEALFLTGFIPMSEDYTAIESLQTGDGAVADVHLFRDREQIWVILVDRTSDCEWQASARQKGNELRLLQRQVAQRAAPDTIAAGGRESLGFIASLDLLALRANDDGSFNPLGPFSSKFAEIYPDLQRSPGCLMPQQRFPFVENFLVDAEKLWLNPESNTRLRSGPWMEDDRVGNEVALEAIALNWQGERLLFLQILDESYEQRHSFLQMGREGVLQNEVLVREVRRQTREIRATEEEIALRLVCAVDSRDDGETGSHIRRLGLYSECMARHLGWSATDTENIRIAAPMHDIGKIGIPDHILKKPGPLTESEFSIMKLHPEIGARILSNSRSPLIIMARDICLGHHEKWDGSGYPRGLARVEIPLAARIVAIADVFDALIHKRIYKPGMTVDDAISQMVEGRGSHFDPELLDLFIRLQDEITEIAYDFRNPIYGDMTV